MLGQVRTYVCAREDDYRYVTEHAGELVTKAVNEAGGYGMLIGPQSTRAQQREFRERTLAKPRNYIAQPRIELSTCPTGTSSGPAPRRVAQRWLRQRRRPSRAFQAWTGRTWARGFDSPPESVRARRARAAESSSTSGPTLGGSASSTFSAASGSSKAGCTQAPSSASRAMRSGSCHRGRPSARHTSRNDQRGSGSPGYHLPWP